LYTVKQTSEITGISAHTIRFYDNEGLFPFVSRDKNNIRLFSDDDLNWVNIVHCLRDTGMPLADIKQYIELCKQGNSTAEERYNIILKQKEKAEQEVIKMQERVELLKKKTGYYKELLENSGDFWNPTNCKAASLDDKK
jgi:DNA-binding transcriptional MerR regulator